MERSGCNGGGAVAKLHHAYNKNRFIDHTCIKLVASLHLCAGNYVLLR
eukprot:COSAG01_NODE_22927_length_833_cov_4.743207_1_plen_47_part_01